MKNIILTVAATVAFGGVGCAAILAADTQSQLAAAYDGQCKAAIAKDGAAFQKFFDPKFVGTDLDGKQVTLPQVVTQITAPPPGITVATCSFSIRNISEGNGIVTAHVTQTVTGTVSQGGGPASPLLLIEESTDTWSVSDSTLQLTSNETGQRVTVDGKVVIEKGTVTAPAPRV